MIMKLNTVILFGWLLALASARFKCHSKIDMVILLDSSASVTEEAFDTIKKFAAELVKHFDISKDKTNVAAISFSQYMHTGRTFSDDVSQENVLKAINGLTYEGSFTRLDFALETILDETFNKDHGARSSSKDLKKVVVAVTDGFSSLGIQNTKELTDRLKTNNIKLFSVGSSDRLNRLNKPELEMMASKPSEIHQLIVDSFSKHQVEQFSKKICNSK